MKKSFSLLKRLDPQRNKVTRVLLLVSLLTIGTASLAFAQSGVPIVDGILQFIEDYKLAIAMLGVAVVGVGLLARVVAPDWAGQHRSAVPSMVMGGIILTMIPTIAQLIVG